jgi:hypothetical protein
MERLAVLEVMDGHWISAEDMLTTYAWCEDKENAQSIVEVCNNYEKLQQINKELIAQLEIMTNCCEDNDDEIDWHSMFSYKSKEYEEIINQAKETLAKAKEV